MNDGTYEVSYTPVKVGDYKLDMKVGGQPVGGKKNPVSLRVIPANVDGSNCVASGPGVKKAKVGEKNPFQIQLRDAFGNDVKMGGADVRGELVAVDGSVPPVPIKAEDKGDGTFDCCYPSVKKAGKYKLVPKVNGQVIKDAPFEIKVDPGITSADNTLVELPDHAVAGRDHIGVTLRDDQLNQQNKGGDNVKAYLLPLTPLEVDARDNGDGTYAVDYPPSLRGDVEVSVKVNGKLAPCGPYNVAVEKNPVKKEQKEHAKKLLPKTGVILGRILKEATESERQAILNELSRLSGGKGAAHHAHESEERDAYQAHQAHEPEEEKSEEKSEEERDAHQAHQAHHGHGDSEEERSEEERSEEERSSEKGSGSEPEHSDDSDN